MLDLVAEVAAEDAEEGSAAGIGRALDLPQVPAAARLTVEVFFGEGPDAFGVGGEVAEQAGQGGGAGQDREEDASEGQLTASTGWRSV